MEIIVIINIKSAVVFIYLKKNVQILCVPYLHRSFPKNCYFFRIMSFLFQLFVSAYYMLYRACCGKTLLFYFFRHSDKIQLIRQIVNKNYLKIYFINLFKK